MTKFLTVAVITYTGKFCVKKFCKLRKLFGCGMRNGTICKTYS